MSRPIPFYFCRYVAWSEDEPLDFTGQFSALKELQGKLFAHGPKAEMARHLDSLVMRPREFSLDGHRALAWSVGRRIGTRVSAEYDPGKDRLEFNTVNDAGIQYADFLAIPELGVLAVDDRAGDTHLGGKAAIGRFRSIFSHIPHGFFDIELTTNTDDVHRALEHWRITEFSFVVRPYNPHPTSDMMKDFSDAMSREKIARLSGTARSGEGQYLDPKQEGQMAAAIELADAGYGQYGVKGTTPDGHEAQIKQPTFNEERSKNQKKQDQPRELRIIIQTDGDEDDVFIDALRALLNFYAQRV
jgi:hypothetical protein